MNLFVEKKLEECDKAEKLDKFDNCFVNDISNLYHELKDSYIPNNRACKTHMFTL